MNRSQRLVGFVGLFFFFSQVLYADYFTMGQRYLEKAEDDIHNAAELFNQMGWDFPSTHDLSVVRGYLRTLDECSSLETPIKKLLDSAISNSNYGSDQFNIFAIGAKGDNRQAALNNAQICWQIKEDAKDLKSKLSSKMRKIADLQRSYQDYIAKKEEKARADAAAEAATMALLKEKEKQRQEEAKKAALKKEQEERQWQLDVKAAEKKTETIEKTGKYPIRGIDSCNGFLLPVSVLTLAQAQGLLNELKAVSRIPFDYIEEGAAYRSFSMLQEMEARGVLGAQTFVFGQLRFNNPKRPGKTLDWQYHVAPFIFVGDKVTSVPYIIDPAFFDAPVKEADWKEFFLGKNPAPDSYFFHATRFTFGVNETEDGNFFEAFAYEKVDLDSAELERKHLFELQKKRSGTQ